MTIKKGKYIAAWHLEYSYGGSVEEGEEVSVSHLNAEEINELLKLGAIIFVEDKKNLDEVKNG